MELLVRRPRQPLTPRSDGSVVDTTSLNVRYLCHEAAWAGIGAGITASFLSIFALRLGASALAVGLLTTGPALAGIIVPVPAVEVVRRRWGKAVIVLPVALTRILFAAAACVPWLPAQLRVPALVASVGVLAIPGAVFNTAFVPLLAKALPAEFRAHVIGVRGTLAGLTSTLTVLLVGKILDYIPFPANFQIVFALGFVTTQVSSALIACVRVPPLNEELDRAMGPGESVARVPRATHAIEPDTAAFWRYTASAAVFLLGTFLPAALYPIIQVDKLAQCYAPCSQVQSKSVHLPPRNSKR
jgi:hypothetical protein